MRAMTVEERERIRALEVQIEHMATTVDHMSTKVDELHSMLMQARGARFALLAIAGLVGFLSGKVGAFVASFLPK
jgi:hypothetical protein